MNGNVVAAALVPLLVIDGRAVRVDEVNTVVFFFSLLFHIVFILFSTIFLILIGFMCIYRQRCEAMRNDKRFKRNDVEQARLEIALAKYATYYNLNFCLF